MEGRSGLDFLGDADATDRHSLAVAQVSKYTIRADFDSSNLHDVQPGTSPAVSGALHACMHDTHPGVRPAASATPSISVPARMLSG